MIGQESENETFQKAGNYSFRVKWWANCLHWRCHHIKCIRQHIWSEKNPRVSSITLKGLVPVIHVFWGSFSGYDAKGNWTASTRPRHNFWLIESWPCSIKSSQSRCLQSWLYLVDASCWSCWKRSSWKHEWLLSWGKSQDECRQINCADWFQVLITRWHSSHSTHWWNVTLYGHFKGMKSKAREKWHWKSNSSKCMKLAAWRVILISHGSWGNMKSA